MTAQQTAPRTGQRQTPAVRPVPKPQPRPVAKPLAMGHARIAVEGIEDELFAAATDLVRQRADLIEAATPENNRLMRRALRALDDDDKTLARELLVAAIFIEDNEDAAARRAETRRERVHGRQKNAVARAEQMITGRELALPWPLEGLVAPATICGAEREPMGAIRFKACGEELPHPAGAHCFEAIGTEQEP